MTKLELKQDELLYLYRIGGYYNDPDIQKLELEIGGIKKQDDYEMYLNMQYYMEYCASNGYVTPQDWIKNHKHF
jgi:hypothetical protein